MTHSLFHVLLKRLPSGLGVLFFLAGCTLPPPPAPPAPSPSGVIPAYHPAPTPAILALKARPVVILQATSSAPDEREREYSEKITVRLADWIREVGIPLRVMTDDQFSRARGINTGVVLLPYNPKPNVAQLQACKRFIESGGKLIVFYGTEPKLAALMGLKLGAFKSTQGADTRTAFRFITNAPPGTPDRIEQNSRNIMPAFPVEPGSRVIAWWETSSGRDPQEPAWTESRHGFWMSHVLTESDAILKEQLLVSLLGACDRTLWQVAAAQVVRQHSTPVMVELYRQGDYPRVLATARKLEAVQTEAIARTQTAKRGEFRGLWNHSGTGFTPGKWDDTCQTLARSGLTAIFPNVQKPWAADYPSKLIPPSGILARYGDQMEACLNATHSHGIEVHAWVILWSLEGASESIIAPYRRDNRLQVTASGKTLSWLCPSHPANRAFELAALQELANRYPALDGIQLDYIRYQSSETCYCSGCRSRFTKATGIHPTRWPADVRSGTPATAYREWRRNQITDFVSAARRDLKKIAPRLKLSASVYPLYPGVRDSIGQDWGEWLRLGLVDFVCPMSYTADTAKFIGWYRKQIAHPGVRGKLFPGIGVTTSECRLNAIQTIDQINALRREGASGFTLFEANPTLEKEILPYLRMGITAP